MKPKMTSKQAKAEADKLLEDIRRIEAKAKKEKLQVSSLDEDALLAKLQGYTSHSPFIYAMAWSGSVTAGGTGNYTVYFQNPSTDPGHYPVFASIFFGAAANALTDETFLQAAARDAFSTGTGWPYMTSKPFNLAPGATANAGFNYKVPAGAPPATYIGNTVLWKGAFHDKGTYFDRGVWYATIS